MESLLKIHKWRAKHFSKLRGYYGKWVAISEDGVVAEAHNAKELLKKIPAELRSQLLFTRVPTPKEAGALVV